LLKLQFHKIIRLKLFGHECVIQYSLWDITVSCESSVFMLLHIQSLVAVAFVFVWCVLTQEVVQNAYPIVCQRDGGRKAATD
jgi:hypothetical protein